MAISNGIFYSQTQGLKLSTNSLNRVIVSTAGTTTFTGITSGSTLIDVRGTAGQLMSVTDTNSGPLLSVNNVLGNAIFQVSSNNSIVGGTPASNTFVVSGTNVGIGTTTPAVKLDVNGAANVNGDLTISGSNHLNFNRIRLAGYTNAFGLDYFFVSARTTNTGIAASFDANGTPAGFGYSFQFKANQAGNDLLFVGDNTTSAHYIHTDSNPSASGWPLIFGVTPANANWSTNTNLLVLTSGQTVGIQTRNPTNTLHVSAATNPVRFEGLISSANTRFLVSNANGVMTYREDVITTAITATTLYSGNGTLGGNRTVNLSTFFLNFSSTTQPNTLVLSSGNVGIGKLPSFKLDVNGDINFPTTTGSTYGIIRQNGNRILHTFGSNNLFLGQNSGNFTLSSSLVGSNIGIGINALNSLSSGFSNVAIGIAAGSNITSGNNNIIVGASNPLSTSSNNVLVGNDIGNTRLGNFNSLVGNQTAKNITGNASGNTGLGYSVLVPQRVELASIGNYNVALGYFALNNEIGFSAVGSNNVALGAYAGHEKGVFDNRLYIANNSGTTLIYGEFDNSLVGINTETPTNALHVSATTDPLRLINVQSASDNLVLTLDGNGVVHHRTIDSINLNRIILRTIELGSRDLVNTANTYTNLNNLMNSFMIDSLNTGSVHYQNYSGASIDYYTTILTTGNTREKYLWYTQTFGVDYDTSVFSNILQYLAANFDYRSIVNFYCEIYLDVSSTCSAPTQVKLTNTLFNSLNPHKYSRNRNYLGTSEFVRVNNSPTNNIFLKDIGTIQSNLIVGWDSYYDPATSNDIPKNIYNIVNNEPNFYGSLSGNSISAITNGLSWSGETRDVIKNSIFTEKNSNFYSKFNIPVNRYGLFETCIEKTNNFYGEMYYDNSGGSEPSIVHDNSNTTAYTSSALLQFIDTYRLFSNGTPAVIYANTTNDVDTKLNDLTYSVGINSSLKYINKNRDNSYLQVLPYYQNIYIVKLGVTGTLISSEINSILSGFVTDYLVINDPALNVNNGYWYEIININTSYFVDTATFDANPYGPYMLIQSNDAKMTQLGTIGSFAGASGSIDIISIYKGQSFKPSLYPLNLNQLTLEVPHSYVYNGSNLEETNNKTCDTFNISNDGIVSFRAGVPDLLYTTDKAINGTIHSVAKQSDGKIIIGGSFNAYDSTSVNYIVRLNLDGTIDNTFNSGGNGFNSDVFSIKIQSDGKILVGGTFSQYQDNLGNYNALYIARLNSDGTFDTTFNVGGNGFDNYVYDIKIQSDGKILVGGKFTNYNYSGGNQNMNGIIRLNSDGTYDSGFNSGNNGFNSGDAVYSIDVYSDGKIAVGGSFANYNGNGVLSNLALLDSNGDYNGIFKIAGGTGFNSDVYSVAFENDGNIICGGNFTSYTDETATYSPQFIARISKIKAAIDSTFISTASFNSTVYSVKIQSDNTILCGGAFSTYNGIPYFCMVNIFPNGTLDLTFNSYYESGTSDVPFRGSYVKCIEITNNNRILIGGDNLTVFLGLRTIRNLIVLYAKGITVKPFAGLNDISFLPKSFSFGYNSGVTVYTIKKQLDEKILVGSSGSGTYSGATYNAYLLKLNSDGTPDTTFNVGGTGFDNVVYSIEVQSDGKILVGGSFGNYNDSFGNNTMGYIARLNSDGTFDTTFNVGGLGFNDIVYSIAIQSNGKILVGGTFTIYNDSGGNQSMNRIARLNSDGTFDTTFNVGGTGFDNVVYSIEVQSDGKILVGGAFSNYNDSFGNNNMSGMVRLNSDGTFDTTFNVGGLGFNDIVYSIKIQVDGKILVGGSFTSYNDSFGNNNKSYIARLNSDGTFDTTFNVGGLGFDNRVTSLVIQGDKKIICGGWFSLYDDGVSNTSSRIARLNSDGTFDSTFNSQQTVGYGFDNNVFALDYDNDNQELLVGGIFNAYGFGSAENIVRLFTGIPSIDILNKQLRFIVKYVKLQKYDLITVPIKLTRVRGDYDNKFYRLTLSDYFENFEMNIYNNINASKRKQLRPGSVEIYMAFFDVDTKITSMIPNYKIVISNYGDNEVFKLIRGGVVINSVSP